MEYINGFCESDQMGGIISSDAIVGNKNDNKPLSSTRIICRFYRGEIPFWNQFIKFHKQLGCRDFFVFTQTKNDSEWIDKNTKSRDLNIECHFKPELENIHYDKQLKQVNASAYTNTTSCKFQMLIDIDEYFIQSRKKLSIENLFEIYGPSIDQVHLPSILALRLDEEQTSSQIRGIWGHVGRPIAKNNLIKAIKNPHSFKTVNSNSLPAGMFGFYIMHLWSRSFEDCLIKIFSRELSDFKSGGSESSFKEIQNEELPRRLRLLAYLKLQEFYINLNMPKEFSFDFQKESDYLSNFITEGTQIKCRILFEEYKHRLKERLSKLPTYPAANFPTIIKALPTLHELRKVGKQKNTRVN